MQNTSNNCSKIKKSSMKARALNCVYTTGVVCTLTLMCVSCVTLNATNNFENTKEVDSKLASITEYPSNTLIDCDEFTDDSNIVTSEVHNSCDYTTVLDKEELRRKYLANASDDSNCCYKNLVELYTTVCALTDEKDSKELKEYVEPIISKRDKCTASELNNTCQIIIDNFVKQEE